MGTMQVYELTVGGLTHRVEATADGGLKKQGTWWLDGREVATKTSREGSIILSPEEEHDLAAVAGAIRVRFTGLGTPVRATWFEGGRTSSLAAATIGSQGIDLVPEADSPAAVREERMRTNPRLYAAVHVVEGVGKVVVPILAALVVAWLLQRLPSIPWPDWDIPSPQLDLPSIPWPQIPWPTIPLPSWDAPDWLVWVMDHLKYVWPILLGLVIARREMTRRREQDELRARMGAGGPAGPAVAGPAADGLAPDGSAVRDVPTGEAEDPEPEEDQPADARDQ